jgi:hypothetical protein
VVIESGAGVEAIVIERPFVALTAGDSESVTSTVKLVVPAAATLGVPEITPPELSERPAGREEPEARDQV